MSFSTNTTEKASVDLNNLSQEGIEKLKEYASDVNRELYIGSSLHIGDVGFTLSDTLTSDRRWCDGSTISSSDKAFASLKNYLNSYPNRVLPSSEYQLEIDQHGVCSKFTFVDDNTIKLPLIENVYIKTGNNTNKDQYIEQSLPNIGGNVYTEPNVATNINAGEEVIFNQNTDGAFKLIRNTAPQVYVSQNYFGIESFYHDVGFSFDASRSSSAYKTGADVNPNAIVLRFFVQVSDDVSLVVNNTNFFGQSIYSEIEINNISWLKSDGEFHDGNIYEDFYAWLVEEHEKGVANIYDQQDLATDYDYIINTNNKTFRLPLKNKLASSSAIAGNGMTLGLTNGTSFAGLKANGTDGLEDSLGLYGSAVGTINTAGGQMLNNSGIGVTTDPAKSGMETSSQGLYLYYYVGDTVKQAQIINLDNFAKTVETKVETTLQEYIPPLVTLSENSGTITLQANKIYVLNMTGDTTFSLPTSVDTSIFNQIKLMVKVTGKPTINWGTSNYFNEVVPEIDAGYYDFYFDYDNLMNSWVAGTIVKGPVN